MSIFYNKERFMKNLSDLMSEHGETTYSLAEYLSMSPSTICRYTNGETKPKAPVLTALADKFNVNYLWLAGGDDQEKYIEKSLKSKKIPILGTIAAGQPIYANESIEGYEFVPDTFNADFCLNVKGDSMINARIYNGDIAYIRKQNNVENGEIAVVLIDGEEATLKRVYKYPGTVILRPENPNYNEMVFDKKASKDIKILGKCIAVKFSLED